MTVFSADDLMHALGGTMTVPFHATGVSIDTRTLQPGELFVALKTGHGNGHDHVAAALARGASGAMVHDQHGMPDDAPLVVVGDTQAGLTALGAFARARFTGSVAAITGSVGKTTTKEMLRLVLSASGRTTASVASYNNQWGVPLTLARMPPDDDYAIVEIGMNNAGEIAPLAILAGPDVAVITNVESAHIGHLGSIEAIADEKASIAKGVLQGGTIVLPQDSPLVDRLREAAGGLGRREFGTANLLSVDEDDAGSDVVARIAQTEIRFRVTAPGRHMVINALAALTAAHALGADIEAGARALAGFAPVSGRGSRHSIAGGRATVLDESYNASVASVRAALAVLALTPARRRVAVLGDMLELGDHSRAEHEALADDASAAADLVHSCGPWMKFLHDALPANRRGMHAAESAEIAAALPATIEAGDVVLVKGSLGSRMRLIVDALTTMPGRA